MIFKFKLNIKIKDQSFSAIIANKSSISYSFKVLKIGLSFDTIPISTSVALKSLPTTF